jgi:organic radical activating enzyme
MYLSFDRSKWTEEVPIPINTLQLFITNKCNLRCKGCFYAHKLGSQEMGLEQYKQYVNNYKNNVQKIVLLGGEPTLHPDLLEMIKYNKVLGLKTTIYTNGAKVSALDSEELNEVEIRIGVYGFLLSEKPLSALKRTKRPITIVYMLRKDNVKELLKTAYSSESFGCNRFYISSIRDITKTQDYWLDTNETVSPVEYARIVQDFINEYGGNLPEIHIAKRGIFENGSTVNTCRFGNIFPDGEKVICPLDISKNITVEELSFGSSKCNKKGCILQKIVLKSRKKAHD